MTKKKVVKKPVVKKAPELKAASKFLKGINKLLKKPPKKLTAFQKAMETPVTDPQEEVKQLRKTLATEPVGSDKGIKAAVKMLDHIEDQTLKFKTKKVQYFHQVPSKPAPVGPVDKKAEEKHSVKIHPKVAALAKAKELPEVPQITLSEVCKDLKLDAAEVRKALRAKKVTKPGAQWSWPKSKKAEVEKLVKTTHNQFLKDQK